MKATWALAALALVGATLPAGEAAAWVKFKNNTPNTIWVAHAYASTYQQVCGWYDSCPGQDNGSAYGWRVEGWWKLDPGQTKKVNTQNYGNAWWQYYANDDAGHYWGNGGYNFTVDYANAFNWCGQYQPSWLPKLQFKWMRSTRCCGMFCTPDDHTRTLSL